MNGIIAFATQQSMNERAQSTIWQKKRRKIHRKCLPVLVSNGWMDGLVQFGRLVGWFVANGKWLFCESKRVREKRCAATFMVYRVYMCVASFGNWNRIKMFAWLCFSKIYPNEWLSYYNVIFFSFTNNEKFGTQNVYSFIHSFAYIDYIQRINGIMAIVRRMMDRMNRFFKYIGDLNFKQIGKNQ